MGHSTSFGKIETNSTIEELYGSRVSIWVEMRNFLHHRKKNTSLLSHTYFKVVFVHVHHSHNPYYNSSGGGCTIFMQWFLVSVISPLLFLHIGFCWCLLEFLNVKLTHSQDDNIIHFLFIFHFILIYWKPNKRMCARDRLYFRTLPCSFYLSKNVAYFY